MARAHDRIRPVRGRMCAPAAMILIGLLWPDSTCAQKKRETYGNTPGAATPYANFDEPYFRFFEKITPFRGAGTTDKTPLRRQTVRIGFLGPPHGDLDPDDPPRQMFEGVTLAIEEANEAGGYDGMPLELVERIDRGLWGATSNEMVAFKYDDDVLAVIGSIDGANSHVALRVALKIQMPMINTATTDPTLTETNIPWLLRCVADDRQQGYALAHHIYRECGLKRVVAFRINDRFGRTGIGEFRDAARRLKAPLLAELRWGPGDRDFGAQLDRIAALKPEALVLWGSAEDCAAVVKEVRQRGMDLLIFGSDRLVCRTFLERAGNHAEGVVAAATWDPTRDDETLRRFEGQFAERYGHAPGAFAAHAYDGTRILIEAVRAVGPDRARIRDALAAYTQYEGVTGTIEFDKTLNDIGALWLATVIDGAFVYRPAEFASEKTAPQIQLPHRALRDDPPANRAVDHEAGDSRDVVRIGCFLPLDQSGLDVVQGIQTALDEDAARHAGPPRIELVTRDARGAWGADSAALTDLVFEHRVLALIGSTERRGTHLAEMLAAKFHFPVVSLCGSDPTITEIPLAWVFRIAPLEADDPQQTASAREAADGRDPTHHRQLGYDAAASVIEKIRNGAQTRNVLRDALASGQWYAGRTGTFRFDALGNRIDVAPNTAFSENTSAAVAPVATGDARARARR